MPGLRRAAERRRALEPEAGTGRGSYKLAAGGRRGVGAGGRWAGGAQAARPEPVGASERAEARRIRFTRWGDLWTEVV